ncbi:MAG: amidohydrolase [Synergistaceae bacterium]|nr:amidohydrolase [Synergistaceae bacterium]
MKNLVERLDAAIEENSTAMAAMSDDFAAHPEISGEEARSSAILVEALKKAGFAVEYPCLGIPHSFLASKGKKGGPKAAVLVEYDALPEIGHACGHNLHGAMSVLAGTALAPLIDETGGELLVIGSPSEETNGAKVEMAEKGIFDGCDFAIMIHSHCGKSIVTYRSLALFPVEFIFTGQTSHAAASPWEGRNALNGAQLFFHAVDMLRQHVRPEVRMHGIISEGGAAANIVPDRAVCRFYFRAPKRAYLDKIMEKIYNCARGAALATETEVSWSRFEVPFKDMLPNESAENMLEEIMEGLGIKVSPNNETFGSSDMGDVSYCCPAVQPELDISEGRVIDGHTRAFAAATTTAAAHEALKKGAKTIGRAVLRVLTEPELREKMRADYKAGIL